MIKLFRKTRKNLLAEGKTSRYLKYAIGEIILVVIGILIAVQINNWNENKKTKVFEKEIIGQIKENLLLDKENLTKIAMDYKRAVYASGKIIEPQNRLSFPDSIKYLLGDVVQFNRLQPITNSYEVLKSQGLETISDQQLRFQLGQYYDDKINHTINAMSDIEISFLNDWLPLLKDHIKDFKFKSYVLVSDEEDFFENTNVLGILILNKDNYGAAVVHLQIVLLSIDYMLELINNQSIKTKSI